MTLFPDFCPLCDEELESWAVYDFHRQVDHDRDWDPCVICNNWDERTEDSEFGPAHPGCADQVALDQAQAHYDRLFNEGAA